MSEVLYGKKPKVTKFGKSLSFYQQHKAIGLCYGFHVMLCQVI